MKEIFEQYGSMIIAIVVAISIFTFWSGPWTKSQLQNLFIGQNSANELNNKSEGNGVNGFRNYRSNVLTVEYVLEDAVPAGVTISVSECFRVTNQAGETEEVYIVKIVNCDSENAGLIEFVRDEFTIHSPGIYEFYLETAGNNAQKQVISIVVPVSEEV